MKTLMARWPGIVGFTVGVSYAVAVAALTVLYSYSNSAMDAEGCSMIRAFGKAIPECVLR